MQNALDNYKRRIREKMEKKMADRYGTRRVIPIAIVVLLLINVVNFSINKAWNPDDFVHNSIIFFAGTVLLEVLLLSILPIVWRFYEVPEEIYLENIDELNKKQKEIVELVEKGKSLTREKVAFDIGLLVQEFESKFNGITTNSSSQEIRRLFSFTGNILDELIDVWIPKAKLVLKNADEVKESIYSINSIRNEYGKYFSKLLQLRENLEEWSKTHDGVTPKDIREPLIEVFGVLWGVDEKCCNVKMQVAIDLCLSNLRQNT